MSDQFVQVAPDSTGKEIQTFENSIAGQTVQAQAVALVDASGIERTSLAVTGPLTDTELRTTPVPVSGTVATGGLTDTQLRATPVPVSGTVTATTGGLTDTQLRATPVPVSGTVTATTGGLTDTQLRATAVPISVATLPSQNVTNTGTFAVQAAAETTKVIGTVNVSAAQTIAVTNAGTFAAQVTGCSAPDATSTYAPTNASSTAYEASRVIKGSAGVLFCVNGYNSKTSAQFIQLHNATSLPSNGTAPVIVFTVPASSNFYIDFGGKFGRYFSTGITIGNSTTGATLTTGTTDCWFDAQYS